MSAGEIWISRNWGGVRLTRDSLCFGPQHLAQGANGVFVGGGQLFLTETYSGVPPKKWVRLLGAAPKMCVFFYF